VILVLLIVSIVEQSVYNRRAKCLQSSSGLLSRLSYQSVISKIYLTVKQDNKNHISKHLSSHHDRTNVEQNSEGCYFFTHVLNDILSRDVDDLSSRRKSKSP
jgi:hypothetical protein